MSDPTDPDTEDRRNDRDRDLDDEREDDLFDSYEDDDDPLEESLASRNRISLFDEDLAEFDLDDLRDMEGPDA